MFLTLHKREELAPLGAGGAYDGPCYGVYDTRGVELSQWLQEAYPDAIELAHNGWLGIDEDQDPDNTRELMFPGLVPGQDMEDIKNAYNRVVQQAQGFQPMANLNDPQVNLIFYCGEEGWRSLADQGRPNLFRDPFSQTVYNVGHDLTMPCDGKTLAITSQGLNANGSRKYGVIFCAWLFERGSLQTVKKVLEYDDDIVKEGAEKASLATFALYSGSTVVLHELFHVTSFDS
ncbi:MAG: hypothetical protein Q9213_001147, partial [Squamulea squamosa]